MPKGRKPIPAKIKLLRGNPSKRKLPPLGLTAQSIPAMPEHFDGSAAIEWRRIVERASAMGILDALDRALLASYCQAWARWLEAEAELQIGGPVLTNDKTGCQYRSPWLDVANRAMAQMREFGVEFGMSPTSRTKIGMAIQAKDDFEEFLKQA